MNRSMAVSFNTAFLDAVHQVDLYFQTQNPTRGQHFASELFDLLYDVVASFPQSQPSFEPLCLRLPGREFRKAVFRRRYLAIYEVLPGKVRFILFRHSSADPNGGFDDLLAELRNQ